MKYMGAAEFKAKCLKVMEEVAASGEEVVVTKRGTPVVRIVPPEPAEPFQYGWGAGAGTFEIVGDIVGPMDTTGWTLDGIPWKALFLDAEPEPPVRDGNDLSSADGQR